MSDLLRRKLIADLQRTSLPNAPDTRRTVSDWHLLWGVLLPAATLAIELGWHLCGESFFDPVPTPWHAALVAFVPAANLFVWYRIRQEETSNLPLLSLCSGLALSISAFYAVLFLPLTPIAAVAVIFYGLGLLPLSPLFACLSAWRLGVAARAGSTKRGIDRHLLAGIAAGLSLLIALDVPAAATRLGIEMAESDQVDTRDRGIALLRSFGDTELLLRLCYDTTGRPTGLLSWLTMAGGPWLIGDAGRSTATSPEAIREVYYRVTGEPFNARPAPFQRGSWARFADMDFDNDLGGPAVGGRVRGLSLVSSRLDGSVAADSAVAYLEWTFEFRNLSAEVREARLEMLLPPGGTISRATLWIDGVEQEAAFGTREATRAAYQEVAVVRRRDPLLVTTKGAGRILAQAFPVPASGTIKFKLGISAPLELTSAASARLVLPAIADRNFGLAADARHSIWIESKTALSGGSDGLASAPAAPGLYRMTGTLSDADLSRRRPAIVISRDPAATLAYVPLDSGGRIRQEITRHEAPELKSLLVIVDGSVRVAPYAGDILKALGAIPEQTPVGLILGQSPLLRVPVAPWGEAQMSKVRALLQNAQFAGGEDNTPALAEALQSMQAGAGDGLLWIHGPQPIAFKAGTGRLEQASERLANLPAITLYGLETGPNAVLPDAPWGWAATTLPVTGGAAADLAAFFQRKLSPLPRYELARTKDGGAADAPHGSEHIAKLWASDEVQRLMLTDAKANRDEAVTLATAHRLVTPVSGAVVLETARQYAEASLEPVAPGTVPTVPEPHEWALLILSLAAISWLAWQRMRDERAAA